MPSQQEAELLDLAGRIVDRARARGVQTAEASARRGWELSARVRLGEPELVEEAGHRSVSLRVISDQRVAATATSDLTESGIERLLSDAVELLELTQADDCAGPAPAEDLSSPPHPNLDLFDPEVECLDAARAIDLATVAERAALAADPRLRLSEGATCSRTSGSSALVLSGGFSATQEGSYVSLVVSPVAEDEGGKKRRGFHWSATRHLAALDDAESVGREAARRTVAKLGARKIPTCDLPVVFDAEISRSVLGTLAGCLSGGAIWRKSSYLVDREGTRVASDLVSVVDDPLLPRGPGSRAFDGEGLRSVRRVVVDRGTLETYLLDWYSARKLGRRSTASASRSGGSVGPSTSNFILQPGTMTKDELIRSTHRGLYVTEMMGFGFNALTGDYSRGAAGFLIEGGELTQAVSEVTVSSNLDRMLKSIDAVANDLELKTSVASPTFRVASMTIAGT